MRDEPDWLKRCHLSDKGAPLPILSNASTALACDPEVRDAFAYDEMLRAPVMLHELGLVDTCERPVTDEDVINLQKWMQELRAQAHREGNRARCDASARSRARLSSRAKLSAYAAMGSHEKD